MTASLLASAPKPHFAERLQYTGWFVDCGAATLRVYARTRYVADQLADSLRRLYGDYPLAADGLADFTVHLLPGAGHRRWLRRQVRFFCDGNVPFEPFPDRHAQPLLEWGANWLLAARTANRLLLHTGALEKKGYALLLPASPGSGKSTLTAALMLRGWRLLSDEFGIVDLATNEILAMPRPIGLKNDSVDIIRAWSAKARLGPEFPNTRKGMVCHLAPDAHSVALRHRSATPGMVLCPKYSVDAETAELTPLSPAEVFSQLTLNAFNYPRTGQAGFESAATIAKHCTGFVLTYKDLEQAVQLIDDLFGTYGAHGK